MKIAIRLLTIALAAALTLASMRPLGAATLHRAEMRIYFIDVEGGQATLFITPDGRSLLIDTGWPGNNGRDARRITDVARLEHLTKIDFVLLTHYHTDHAGGVPQLAAQIPIGTFIDHGDNREKDAETEKGYEAYKKLLASGKYGHLVVKPGDFLPLGITAEVVSADGNLIQKPLPDAGAPNSACAKTQPRPADQTENARSLGILITFGKLKILDLGDLTWDKEIQLMCPANKLGRVDLYIVSHHGWDQSGSPALVEGIHPEVAIMDNGAKKGGSSSTWQTIHDTPGLLDLWQLHYSEEGGAAHNVPAASIANPQGPDQGNYLKVTVRADGWIEVANPASGKTKEYQPRP